MLSSEFYIPLCEDYRNKTIEFVICNFIQKEHITQVFDIGYADLYPLVSWLCDVGIAQGLSYIAVDNKTDEVIGFFLAKSSLTEFIDDPNPKMQVIAEISNTLMQQTLQNAAIREEFCHLLLIGFDHNRIGHQRRNQLNFMMFMRKMMAEFLQKKRFRYTYMECTNSRSQKIARYFGGKEMGRLEYAGISSDYAHKNSVDHETCCIAYMIKLF